jgi:hypothetical protein
MRSDRWPCGERKLPKHDRPWDAQGVELLWRATFWTLAFCLFGVAVWVVVHFAPVIDKWGR